MRDRLDASASDGSNDLKSSPWQQVDLWASDRIFPLNINEVLVDVLICFVCVHLSSFPHAWVTCVIITLLGESPFRRGGAPRRTTLEVRGPPLPLSLRRLLSHTYSRVNILLFISSIYYRCLIHQT